MSWAYRISMQMKLFIALFPLLLALVWFAGSGIVSRINTEQQMNTIGQLTTSPALRASVVSWHRFMPGKASPCRC
ncbi:hypothetical protein QR099_23955, partial [Salmonella enterica]|nr:hypothetical protein [Salmonella enterica]